MNKGFTVQSIMTRVSSTSDGGLSIGFHTKELPAEEKAKVMEFHQQAGWLLFKENDIKEEEVPTEQAEMNVKTPSQRLRAVLFVFHKQQGIREDFDTFYKSVMEGFINDYKAQLI